MLQSVMGPYYELDSEWVAIGYWGLRVWKLFPLTTVLDPAIGHN
jgi:hypothetical protein